MPKNPTVLKNSKYEKNINSIDFGVITSLGECNRNNRLG